MIASRLVLGVSALLCLCSCSQKVRITVVNPGHFHAAMVLREDLPGVDKTVSVCSPRGEGIDSWTASVQRFNSRENSPTHWTVEEVNPLPKASSPREVAVLAGDNSFKAKAILHCVELGYNVLSDKPMALDSADMATLSEAYRLASRKGLVILDLMTERHDEVNIATRRALANRTLCGGSPENPGIVMESIHHFYKEVDGVPLRRPAWYYDVRRQGEGIADVTTHLIDLVMWQCFPDEAIDSGEVEVVSASHFPTEITVEQFSASTGAKAFPSFLADRVEDGSLHVYSNGTVLLRIRDLYVKIYVRWDFAGGPDTFSAVYNCENGQVRVLQDSSTGYTRKLLDCGQDITPQITLTHEDHFSLVMNDFLRYVRGAKMPAWEAPNTLAKYSLTTSAVQKARLSE